MALGATKLEGGGGDGIHRNTRLICALDNLKSGGGGADTRPQSVLFNLVLLSRILVQLLQTSSKS